MAGVIAELELKNRENAENESTIGVLTYKERKSTVLETTVYGWIDLPPSPPRMARLRSG